MIEIKIPIYDAILIVFTSTAEIDARKVVNSFTKFSKTYDFDISDTLEGIIKMLKEDVKAEAKYEGVTYTNIPFGVIVLNKFTPSIPRKLGTLSHEIFHYITDLLKYKGMSLSEDSEEAYAYLVSYITEEFWKQYNKLNVTTR